MLCIACRDPRTSIIHLRGDDGSKELVVESAVEGIHGPFGLSDVRNHLGDSEGEGLELPEALEKWN